VYWAVLEPFLNAFKPGHPVDVVLCRNKELAVSSHIRDHDVTEYSGLAVSS
jgi:hypothetical protein